MGGCIERAVEGGLCGEDMIAVMRIIGRDHATDSYQREFMKFIPD